jgi:ssDNA-binding Zn-finger/Zn-ribbon topoisomerase 1
MSLTDLQQQILQPVFDSALPEGENRVISVTFEAMPENSTPVVITRNEFMRRAKEMARNGGGSYMGLSYDQLQDFYTLVINGNNHIIDGAGLGAELESLDSGTEIIINDLTFKNFNTKAILFSGKVIFNNVNFTDFTNSSMNMITISRGSLTANNCHFYSNQVESVLYTYNSLINIINSSFLGNKDKCGAIEMNRGQLIIHNSSFENFTAEIEGKLDEVAEGKVEWPKMMGDFFFPFKNHVDEVMSTLESVKGSMDEVTDKTCELCGKPMLKKLGRFGYFLACSGFPECHNTKSIPLAKCPRPECNGEIVERKNKGRSKSFYGCTNYPTCDFISHFKPIDQNCPKCGWFMVEKYDKKHGSFKSCINPDCTYLHTAGDEIEN